MNLLASGKRLQVGQRDSTTVVGLSQQQRHTRAHMLISTFHHIMDPGGIWLRSFTTCSGDTNHQPRLPIASTWPWFWPRPGLLLARTHPPHPHSPMSHPQAWDNSPLSKGSHQVAWLRLETQAHRLSCPSLMDVPGPKLCVQITWIVLKSCICPGK